ncbi:thylakoid lumenal 17.9 kDa protein, chloroplastic [Ananas comosus]|uniref:Thylakoid lumenal 17.9 kDa protein, chloroplastic n=1 Tax=Ananas comosus TaxID=4615 RepID=A0A6P5GZW6_ANACO|nr:thylakoid lumenal 17.9 kDa protein, chloroplastic [Ananas comosus]
MSLQRVPNCSPFPCSNTTTTIPYPKIQTLTASFFPLSLALTLALNSPLPSHAIPSPTFMSDSSLQNPTTPYSQSKNLLQLGLENGKIRPCPSINPGCVSTNPKSSSFASPLLIPEKSADNAIQKLRDAVLKTQRNVKINVDEETPTGHYLQAEVDGGFGRDVLEFLVKRDHVVAYRSMATKVTYVYPFTTALGDSKGQKERVRRIAEELGWFAPPDFETMAS